MAADLTGLLRAASAAVLGLSFLAVGCGGGSLTGSGTGGGAGGVGGRGGAASLCVPGAAVVCACSDGTSGAQVCEASGSGYGACSCTGLGAAGAAGSTGVAGAGGAAGTAGAAGRGAGGAAGSGGAVGGAGGGAGARGAGGAGGAAGATITPFSGNYTCTDFDTNGACTTFDTSKEATLDGGGTGSAPTIAYPLDHALFPYNLGPIEVQLASPGTAARLTFQTISSSNVNVEFYGPCEAEPGTGCSIRLPLAFMQRLAPACQIEDIQLTGRVLAGAGTVTADSAPINVAWTTTGVSGGLYYWTVLPNQSYCPGGSIGTATPGTYCLLDTTQSPKNGTAIYRYDFSQTTLAPQQVWTDDGGPNSAPSYQGAPQSWDNGVASGHCIGCHSISNDGKFMGLTIGGSSTYNAANWALLDIQNQDLLLVDPTRTGGNNCNDPNASPTNDPTCYWQQFRKDAYATEMTWGPNDDAAVSMYMSKLFFDTVSATAGTSTATLAQTGPALPTSATPIDPYQSDPFWSHSGALLVYTSFAQPGAASATGNPSGLNGDLKTGGQIAIADATPESITDDARVLVPRQANLTSYYPCVSDDDRWVVFNQSNCGGNPSATDINYNGTASYGTGVCDGYDDSTAKLYLVSTAATGLLALDNANGAPANYDNSFPRFGPDVGTFRGQALYWMVFSSRRPYGVQNDTGGLGTSQPQLWFAAVATGAVNATDPSFAPVWLPSQNPAGNGTPYGNHTPQWVRVPVTLDVP